MWCRLLFPLALLDVLWSGTSAREGTGRSLARGKILNKRISEKDLLAVLRREGHDVAWIEAIREGRKLFFHQTAPWIALQINVRHPLECSLLVMKENLHKFDDPEKYVTQQQLVDAIQGLQRAMWAVQQWLEDQIVEAEQGAT